jgi:hypothetical protein
MDRPRRTETLVLDHPHERKVRGRINPEPRPRNSEPAERAVRHRLHPRPGHPSQFAAAEKKRRRVESFKQHLPGAWAKLDCCFKIKYTFKLRRETQRLLLLERGVPIPPTLILDTAWANLPETRAAVWSRLKVNIPSKQTDDLWFEMARLGRENLLSSESATRHTSFSSVAQALLG